MRDEQTGDSKGFGFVSYTRPDEAANALYHMNGAPVQGEFGLSPAITVRFHEPRNYASIFTKARDRQAGPRQRGGSFDEGNLIEDITRRVKGMSPPSSPRSSTYGSPDHAALRPLSMSSSSSGSSSPPTGVQPLSPGTMTPATEKDRLSAGLEKVEKVKAEQRAGILDLLMSLRRLPVHRSALTHLLRQRRRIELVSQSRSYTGSLLTPRQYAYSTLMYLWRNPLRLSLFSIPRSPISKRWLPLMTVLKHRMAQQLAILSLHWPKCLPRRSSSWRVSHLL